MEDNRGKFGVIVAGYTENMHLFIESNPGFKSRFDKTFVFEDYTPEQLWEIGKSLLAREGLTPDPAAEAHLRSYLSSLYEYRDKFFGNARTVRQVIGDVVVKQHLRLASLPSDQRSSHALSTLSFEDVKHLEARHEGRKPLGFRREA
jgi:hypothetical protein